MRMEQLANILIDTEKVKEHLRHYSREVHPIVRGCSQEAMPELAELALIYNMLHSLRTNMAKDMEFLAQHLSSPENQSFHFVQEKKVQQHPLTVTTSKPEKLSHREREVLLMFAKGCKCREVAKILDCKVATIQTYAKRIHKKLKVHSRSEAIFEATNLGIINLNI